MVMPKWKTCQPTVDNLSDSEVSSAEHGGQTEAQLIGPMADESRIGARKTADDGFGGNEAMAVVRSELAV